MAHRTDPGKVFCFNRPGYSKVLIHECKLVWSTPVYKRDLLCCIQASVASEHNGQMWKVQLL